MSKQSLQVHKVSKYICPASVIFQGILSSATLTYWTSGDNVNTFQIFLNTRYFIELILSKQSRALNKFTKFQFTNSSVDYKHRKFICLTYFPKCRVKRTTTLIVWRSSKQYVSSVLLSLG